MVVGEKQWISSSVNQQRQMRLFLLGEAISRARPQLVLLFGFRYGVTIPSDSELNDLYS